MKNFTLLLLLVTISYSSAKAQYCMLPGRTSYSTNQPGIINFKLRNINRSSANVENPLSSPSIVETGDSTVLERGKTYALTILHTKDATIPAFANARNNIRVWLDYNGNKDFTDAGETIITKDFVAAGTFTDSFTVPMTATLGTTRLRATAKMSSDAGHVVPTPCDEPKDPIDYHGEMEDYWVTIVAEGTAVNEVTGNVVSVNLYPNPTTDKITVTLSDLQQAPLTIELYNITGKKISTLVEQQVQNANTYQFNLAENDAGVYFLKIVSGNNISYKRIVRVN
ncbi:MAG: T9SS type A sorting domain-containing protein [Chitinophagaceae bacterium]|nr:T9SS type A sorting domain-containing protein [Chitinophagaceae bacterium]MCB9046132.1 T9SS type A sorting domain-containing protein [Chitinophagales bacterium]